MKKVFIAAAALGVLCAPALAQSSSSGQNAGRREGGQMRQGAGGEPVATTGSTKNEAKSRKRRMNTTSGNCWDFKNPACQNYRSPRR